MEETKEIREKAILVAADTGAYDMDISFAELTELAEADDVEIVGEISQKRDAPESGSYLGKGKLEEIKEMAVTLEADLLIFDAELNATQIRNIEHFTEVRTIDRTMLILDIFSSRARSSEGRVQVELARQRYLLPRLSGMGKTLSRLGGGGGGGAGARRGAGETQLETDRRHIRRRIQLLENDLSKMEQRRSQMRLQRKKSEIPTIAIVGYTNVGKSTLINALTGSDVEAKDMLFATLDPTARKLELPDGRSAVIIDTVGLIRRLPHHLVEAFHSTLEEAADADLILLVCDISSEESREQIEVTQEILKELNAEDIPVLTVYNKADLPHEPIVDGEKVALISAKSGKGLPELLEKIEALLPNGARKMRFLLPHNQVGILNKIRQDGKVFQEEYTVEGLLAEALVEPRYQKLVEPYEI